MRGESQTRGGRAPRGAAGAPSWRKPGAAGPVLAFLLLSVLAAGAAGERFDPAPVTTETPPRRILVLTSFGSDFALYNQIISDFRTQLAARYPESLEFYEVPLDLARASQEEEWEPFVGYLTALTRSRRPSLVVTLGGPALRFVKRYEVRLFAKVPRLFAATDVRILREGSLGPLDATVPVENDITRQVEALLALRPETRNLALVFGSSPLERFWRETASREFGRFEPRLHLIWLDGLTLAELRARVAVLPPRSAIYFGLFLVDRTGVPYSQDRVLSKVHEVANAPIIGPFDHQVGLGALGGAVLPMARVAERSVEAATRLLSGEPPATVRFPPLESSEQLFDARELERWGIPESRLPAGSIVRFRQPSLWADYRGAILGGLLLIGLQAALIAGLVLHRARRYAAEREVLMLHGRLVAAFEVERRRLARELHDDVTQRLARLVIDGAQVEQLAGSPEALRKMHSMREELVQLGRDVHDLSRRLHPTILYDLGLAEAVRSEADRFARGGALALDLHLDESAAARVPPELGLTFFRVVQEALRNVERHAHATRVEIVLAPSPGGIELRVRDDGVGFDSGARGARLGLGHVSLRERMHVMGGRFSIESAPGRGTTVRAWAPLEEVTS